MLKFRLLDAYHHSQFVGKIWQQPAHIETISIYLCVKNFVVIVDRSKMQVIKMWYYNLKHIKDNTFYLIFQFKGKFMSVSYHLFLHNLYTIFCNSVKTRKMFENLYFFHKSKLYVLNKQITCIQIYQKIIQILCYNVEF